jgi:hypothetical protein
MAFGNVNRLLLPRAQGVPILSPAHLSLIDYRTFRWLSPLPASSAARRRRPT